MRIAQEKQTHNNSWKTNLILGYLEKKRQTEIDDFRNNLQNDHDLYFVNYKNSMLGVGGVGTVTRSLLKIFPDLKMICYDPQYTQKVENVITVDLNKADADLFHGVYAKLYLWPVLHNLESNVSESEVESVRNTFLKCSKQFAEKVAETSKGKKSPIFWVNDYNLACVPGYIREISPESTIIFSLRTPFGVFENPNLFDIDAKLIAESLLNADIISFHREKDVLHFLDFINKLFTSDPDVKINWEEYTIKYKGRIVIPRAFPMGNDPEYRIGLAKNKESRDAKLHFKSITKGKLITSVSRFDKTKGVDFELDCIESLLNDFPQLKEKFTFLRVSYLSDMKKNTPAYTDIFNHVLNRIDEINSKYGTDSWKPIVGMFDSCLTDVLMTGLYRATDVLLIGSLGDGFNHISVESVMSKIIGDAPLQIVTTDIGATDYLEGYDQIFPNDVRMSANNIHKVLTRNIYKVLSNYFKLRNSASRLYAYNWAMGIIQASMDITKLPILSKINN
ncbi:trehalose-6-phosphate synthase [bacterium]|nr:trehalose-6-phosphate synthase [bacterium]